MSKIYIGIDNGVTGTIAIIKEDETVFVKTPVFKQMSFQKTKKQNINRLDFNEVHTMFSEHIAGKKSFCFIERPMINSTRFKAGLSAVRCLEATLILLEMFEIPYEYVDSKQWQKDLLPGGIKDSAMLKEASANIGARLFPEHADLIKKHKDADGLLIAEYARRHNL